MLRIKVTDQTSYRCSLAACMDHQSDILIAH